MFKMAATLDIFSWEFLVSFVNDFLRAIPISDSSEFQSKRIVILDMKWCVCHFVKWRIHPFISKGTNYATKMIYQFVVDQSIL